MVLTCAKMVIVSDDLVIARYAQSTQTRKRDKGKGMSFCLCKREKRFLRQNNQLILEKHKLPPSLQKAIMNETRLSHTE